MDLKKRNLGRVVLSMLMLVVASCGGHPDDIELGDSLDEPDRILYSRALFDLERGQFTRSRILFNNLINTYPDSEYLPLSKFGLGETFYRGGTRSNLVQAQAEFKDFITFFPTSPRSDDAQLWVAMSHIKQMEKSDRDPTQGLLAEIELKNMIAGYPDSNLLDEAKDKLRAVQEIVADGGMRVGNFYSTTGNYAGAVDRYLEILDKYPDFTNISETLYRLAETMLRGQNQGEAIVYYNRVIRNYPLSKSAEDATKRLAELEQPIPDPNPAALERAQSASAVNGKSIFSKMFGLWSRRPDISTDTAAASIIGNDEDGDGQGLGEGTFEVEGTVIDGASPPGQ
jgi:outer membrane protein assembly factor BamD